MNKSTKNVQIRRAKQKPEIVDSLRGSLLAGLLFFSMITWQVGASAQGTISQAIQPANQLVNCTPAGQAPAQGMPPPPGSGANAPLEIGGDTGSPPPLTSGAADRTAGTRFPTAQNVQNATTVYVYVQTYSGPNGTTPNGLPGASPANPAYRGLRMAMTIRPNTLTQDQINSINTILGINMQNGQEIIPVTTTTNNVELINTILYPGASQQKWGISQMENGVFPNGRLVIKNDPSTGVGAVANVGSLSIQPQTSPLQRPWDASSYITIPYITIPVLPYVYVMGRWLVIAGVVFATVKISLAAYAVAMGHPYAGSRVIAAVSGLMMLLASFTIYKIVRMNAGQTGPAANVYNNSQTSGAGAIPASYPNVPGVPTAASGQPKRSGIPVIPLSGN
jgi:hypothetical protein